MKTILVTGGAGFVGSQACKALARRGFRPVVFDNFERGHDWAVKWGPLAQGDIRDESDLHRAFEAWRPWAVMHFAAYAYVGESSVEPIKYYYTYVGGTAKLLKVCAAFECRRVVFSSSCRYTAFRRVFLWRRKIPATPSTRTDTPSSSRSRC